MHLLALRARRRGIAEGRAKPTPRLGRAGRNDSPELQFAEFVNPVVEPLR